MKKILVKYYLFALLTSLAINICIGLITLSDVSVLENKQGTTIELIAIIMVSLIVDAALTLPILFISEQFIAKTAYGTSIYFAGPALALISIIILVFSSSSRNDLFIPVYPFVVFLLVQLLFYFKTLKKEVFIKSIS